MTQLKPFVYSTEIDIYSFGVILNQLFIKEIPYDDVAAVTVWDLMYKIANGERPKMKSNLPKNVKELISKCWDNNPLERPSWDIVIENLKVIKSNLKN